MAGRSSLILVMCLLFSLSSRADGASGYTLEKIAEGFSTPTAIVQPPGDTHRLFVADLNGKIAIIENGTLLAAPFLDVSANITTKAYGQGLHNLVFHPRYAENGLFYIAYSQPDQIGRASCRERV